MIAFIALIHIVVEEVNRVPQTAAVVVIGLDFEVFNALVPLTIRGGVTLLLPVLILGLIVRSIFFMTLLRSFLARSISIK